MTSIWCRLCNPDRMRCPVSLLHRGSERSKEVKCFRTRKSFRENKHSRKIGNGMLDNIWRLSFSLFRAVKEFIHTFTLVHVRGQRQLETRVSHQNMFFWNKKIPTQSRGIWVVGWRIPKGFLISTTFRGCTRLSKIWPLHRGQFIKCDSNAEVYLISETMTQASMAKSLR